MSGRRIIVNADDFGQSAGVNLGVAEGHESGIVTSASLMVRWPAAAEAAHYARDHPKLGVGLHLDLGEWALRDGAWAPLYEVADLSDGQAVKDEIARQLDRFFAMMGRLPTHIDTHQHTHSKEPVRSLVCEAARRYGMAVRGISVPFCGRFYGQDENAVSHPEWIGVPAFLDVLKSLAAEVTEIACHPAGGDDLTTMYGAERLLELQTLCDPKLRLAIADLGFELVSFADWRAASP